MLNSSKCNDKEEDKKGNRDKEHQNHSNSLLLQLHEQYAINNNANLSSIITIIVAAFAVIGVYGYVFVHSTLYSNDLGHLFDSCTKLYSLDVLLMSCLASVLIVLILICICAYQGVAQRKEQFIIHAIRIKSSCYLLELLPHGYSPFHKFGLSIVQGLYGEIIKIFNWVIFSIIVSTIWKLFFHVCHNCSNGVNCFFLTETVIVFIIIVIAIFLTYRYYYLQIYSYIIRQVEYSKYMNFDELKPIIKRSDDLKKHKAPFIQKRKIVYNYNKIRKLC